MRTQLVLSLAFLACSSSGPTEQERRLKDLEQLARTGPYADATMFDISRAYGENQFAADAKYKGYPLRVSGQVASVMTNKDGDPILSLGPNSNSNLVVCFWTGIKRKLERLRPGDGITVTAIGGGMANNQIPMLGFCDTE